MPDGSLQTNRFAKLYTPLGDDVLRLYRLHGFEAVGKPFEWRIEALSDDESIEEASLIGHGCAVEIGSNLADPRFFHGVCTRARWLGRKDFQTHYELTLHPEIWFLTLQFTSRMFQDKTIVDIIKDVFESANFTNFNIEVTHEYPVIPYCVQYHESNLMFVSRLMEKYGLFYYFTHQKERHTMQIVDSNSAIRAVEGYEKIPFTPDDDALLESERLETIEQSSQVRPDEISVNDYNYEHASTRINYERSEPGGHGRSGNEIYDFRLGYFERNDGEQLARICLEAERAQTRIVNATGNVPSLFAGSRIEIENDPLPEPGEPLACIRVHHTAVSDSYISTAGNEDTPDYQAAYEFIPWATPFRSPKRTPWPRISGPVTAKVATEGDEEIDVDDQGRILVNFHWDRDQQNSCRIRVSQAMAGKGFGSSLIPRVGHEVLVSFIDGDPDRPIVTGTVYNSDNQPPIGYPAAKTQSGLKSNSSKGGGGANEIKMDDAKEKESFELTAEKDFTQTVKNDANVSIGFEKASPGNFTQKVKQDHTTEVESGNKSTTVKAGNHTLSVDAGTSTVTIASGRTETIQAGGDTLNVTGDRKIEASDSYQVTTPDAKIDAGTKAEVSTTELILSGSSSNKLGADAATVDVVGNTLKISGMTSIEIVSGPSSIKLDASGVTVVAPMIKLN